MSTIAQPIPRATLANRVGRRARDWIPAVAVFGLGILAWQWFLPDVVHVKRFLLPRFSDVMRTFLDGRDTLWSAGWFTFKEAVGGFALGCSFAFLMALALARWRPIGRALMPYAIAANAIPIIAFAPITNAWFGILSPWSKVVIAAVLCFFPVLVNALRGLTSVPPESIELMRSYAGGEAAIFRRVRIPTSLPFVCTRDDRRSRGRLLWRVDEGARDPDPVLGDAFAIRVRVVRDPRGEHPRDRVLQRDRSGRAARAELASIDEKNRRVKEGA
jgi:ABC-type nitrate/sulfonate/bicarbonate transport system permease component